MSRYHSPRMNLFEPPKHSVFVDITAKEFDGGDKVNEAEFNLHRDMPYVPLVERLIGACNPNETDPLPSSKRPLKAEEVAQVFHADYERLAPDFGYETRKASAVPWSQVPVENRALAIATVKSVMKTFFPQRLAD